MGESEKTSRKREGEDGEEEKVVGTKEPGRGE